MKNSKRSHLIARVQEISPIAQQFLGIHQEYSSEFSDNAVEILEDAKYGNVSKLSCKLTMLLQFRE